MHQKITFDNGLRLIHIPNKATKSASIFVLFGVGSRYENRDINGASHFIEHLMFKGTLKRPSTLDISKTLDSVGAEYNAATSKDWTGYYVKIDSKKFALAVDVVSDMLQNSLFDPSEINKERGVIIEEINMYHDNPIMYIEDVLEQVMFQGSTLGWEIAGPKKVIREVSRKKLVDYKDKYYTPPNMVIGIAGNINKKKAVDLVERYFNTSQSTNNAPTPFKPYVSSQKEARVKVIYKKTEQVQLAFGFPGVSYSDENLEALTLLSVILGGNMSSRLFLSVRERRGLAYFIRSYTNIYQDTGNLVIQSGLDKSRLEEAIKVILSELKKIKKQGVTASELKKAKDYIRGKVVLTLEDSSNLADWYVKHELLENTIITPEQKFKKFETVTASQIKKMAANIFISKAANLAIIGPYKNKKPFEKLLQI